MTFQAHGNFVLRVRGDVLRVDAWGPWNLECTAAYAAGLSDAMATLPSPFAILAVSHVQPILGPDAEQILRRSVRDRLAMGCRAMATVLLEQSGSFVARSQYERIYSIEGIPHRLFVILADAQDWLASSGFSAAHSTWKEDEMESALRRQQRASLPVGAESQGR